MSIDLRTRNNYSFPTSDGTKYIKDITIFNNIRAQKLFLNEFELNNRKSEESKKMNERTSYSACFSKDYQILRGYVSITYIF